MDSQYWSHLPSVVNKDNFDPIFSCLIFLCKRLTVSMYGKSYPSRRMSCIFTNSDKEKQNKAFDHIPVIKKHYKQTPKFDWDDACSEIKNIRNIIETKCGIKTEYVLCHIYFTGFQDEEGTLNLYDDNIGWHNDKEALKTDVVSVSLGSSRTFEIKAIGSDDVNKIYLKSGDLLHMFGCREGRESCQQKYVHRVPKMSVKDLKRYIIEEKELNMPKMRHTYENVYKYMHDEGISPIRINLTFRKFE